MIRRLAAFAVLQASGPEARTFLQGQLSNDVQQLDNSRALLASLNSPQGRVQAILVLLQRDADIQIIVPAELAAATLTRLQKYVLRAKVKLTDITPERPLFAASAAALSVRSLPVPVAPGAVAHAAGMSVLRWPSADERYAIVGEVVAAALVNADFVNADFDPVTDWQLADIRAGLPQVFAATHETFVAQMLNLDLLNGISFDKGCYTGQEIIARTHYRGAIKRRMFRFAAACPPPSPGTRITSNGETAGEVVMSAATPPGCELLAVVALAHLHDALELTPAATPLARQPLPYDIPMDF